MNTTPYSQKTADLIAKTKKWGFVQLPGFNSSKLIFTDSIDGMYNIHVEIVDDNTVRIVTPIIPSTECTHDVAYGYITEYNTFINNCAFSTKHALMYALKKNGYAITNLPPGIRMDISETHLTITATDKFSHVDLLQLKLPFEPTIDESIKLLNAALHVLRYSRTRLQVNNLR